MPASIILKGYYGFGNLGDDILMLSIYGWLSESYPEAKIQICTNGDKSSYIPKLLSASIEIIRNHEDVKTDWIIHGGGGVYFDFEDGGIKFRWLNALINFVGKKSFQKIYKQYRSIRGTIGPQGKFRVGFGIGVGTYTPSSHRLYADILELFDFKFLLVRDEESEKHLRQLNVPCPIKVSSDLAFMDNYWKPQDLSKNKREKTIGFVLRDWVYDNHAYFPVIKEVADRLISSKFEVQFFSFDRFSDTAYLQHFAEYEVLSWDPYNQTTSLFLKKLNECSLVITSRAHGAIIAACLGIPALCLEIEPKLKHVATLLKHSSLLVSKPFDKDKLVETILARFQILDLLENATNLDKEFNRKKMEDGLSMFKRFVREKEFEL